ncbi:hypothetical protein KP77_27220 [Jeotgalibacillus alimentarius]|uniref:Phosphoribosyltransferase domain-containing protein n=1 Tax=Jeotgalibacillus alimentarius TaxID=135826 RepID=A0A0C2R8M8_9BACL|nr:ComF family protein [Jeotgalibacillus alimentarius]KIL46595.1 hypothetical protein KP77_27220 [Jeotgalibacillus alimentarius]
MRCLYCHTHIFEEIGWSDLIFKRVEDPFCAGCRSTLIKIEGARCKICSRSMKSEGVCSDCDMWSKHSDYSDVLTANHSIYEYNDSLKELIKRFKYNGDYALAGCFRKELIEHVKLYKKFIIVPMPVSSLRLKERGFNQTEALLECAGVSYENLLKRVDTETSQAKKQKAARHSGENPFQSGKAMNGENILLIDDLYTTGTTIRRAASVLKKTGAGEVRSVTIGR